jgi:hypothetical protein
MSLLPFAYSPDVAFSFLIAALVGILLLLGFILSRRMLRSRYFRKRDLRTLWVRKNWQCIIQGKIPEESWINHSMDIEIIETILLDQMDDADLFDRNQLHRFACNSGLLDRRIREARIFRGWRRRRALVALGRMRSPEGVPALAEALSDRNPSIVLEAVCGLGQIGTPLAADHIMRCLQSEDLKLNKQTLQMALVNCYRTDPSRLLDYMVDSDDTVRPILARVLAEVGQNPECRAICSLWPRMLWQRFALRRLD